METVYQNQISPKLEARLREVRKIISDMGSMLGKTICYLQVDNVDLSHKEKEINNNHPRLVVPLLKFMVNSITISEQKILTIGDDVYLEFNGKENLRAKIIQNPKFFADASDNAIIEEAVERAMNGGTPIFFANRQKLTAEANFRNKQEMEKADRLANEFLQQAQLLSDLTKAQEHDCEEYYKQLGLV